MRIMLVFTILILNLNGFAHTFEKVDTLPSKYKNLPSAWEVDQKPIYKTDSCVGLEDEELRICTQKQMFAYIYSNLEHPPPSRTFYDGISVAAAIIGKDGKVIDAFIIKSYLGGGKNLEDSFLRAVKRLEFEPAEHQGQVVECRIYIPIRFHI